MARKGYHAHIDRAAESERAAAYPVLLVACKARGMRTVEDFSPSELAILRAKVSGWIAAGTCRVTGVGDAPLQTL